MEQSAGAASGVVNLFQEASMKYYMSTTVEGSFDGAVEKVTEELGKQGFGVLTDIDVKATMKQKLGEDFRNYRILGACNPPFAHRALLREDKIGTLLPCNVIVQEQDDGGIEVAAVNPVASMQAIDNPELEPVAEEIRGRLQTVIDVL
jgi:uncharacterized protein (DUF302 family)